MKSLLIKLTVVFALVFQLTCCEDRYSSRYTLELPDAPQAWVQLLGEPDWRIEWLDPNGKRQSKDILHGAKIDIEIPVTWTNPVVAYPWWPKYNLISGLFRPAGALFPHDVSGGKLRLTWKAGVDAVFYFGLAFANSKDIKKIPSNFDWIRFRELFETGDLSEDVCNDPWLVDWQSAAERTISGNFDRRRLVPRKTEAIDIPIPASVWYGTSPFAEPLIFTEEETLVFYAHSGINAWISAEGILRCNGKVWFFTPFE
jgi:hypothetical protein